jgi:hypothetical protein
MAKVAEQLDSPEVAEKLTTFSIHKREPKQSPGRYDAQVLALIAADEETGEQNNIDILVPTGEEAKYKRSFQASARAHGKGARVDSEDVQGDGFTLIAFYLTNPVQRGTNKGDTPSGDDSDVPTAA